MPLKAGFWAEFGKLRDLFPKTGNFAAYVCEGVMSEHHPTPK
jgi:hypothetical protein